MVAPAAPIAPAPTVQISYLMRGPARPSAVAAKAAIRKTHRPTDVSCPLPPVWRRSFAAVASSLNGRVKFLKHGYKAGWSIMFGDVYLKTSREPMVGAA